MSKQSRAKVFQDYQPKAVPVVCCNCLHFTSDKTEMPSMWSGGPTWIKENNLRCGIGGFKVAKMGTCRLWEPKAISQPTQPKTT